MANVNSVDTRFPASGSFHKHSYEAESEYLLVKMAFSEKSFYNIEL